MDVLIEHSNDAALPMPQGYRLTGTVREKLLDDVALVTARLFAVPIAVVALAPEAAGWLSPGVAEARRDGAARPPGLRCAAAIRYDYCARDPGLEADPGQLLSGGGAAHWQLRFAAARNVASGPDEPVGALFLFDEEPRTLSVTEQAVFGQLAHLVALLLELRTAAVLDMDPTFWGQVEEALGPPLRRLRLMTNKLRRADSEEARERGWQAVLDLTVETIQRLS
ncbi:MAG TPA: hypothetical protein VF630_13635 [Hymenobacter sp.]|jgi:hypothetical protein